MVLIGDMSSVFIAGRLLGCSVLTVTKNDIKSRKIGDIIFMVFSMALYLGSFVGVIIYVFLYTVEDFKGMFILGMRILLFYACLFTSGLVTTLWNWKFRSVLSQLRNFDRVTNYRDSSTGVKLRVISCILVAMNSLYWTIGGYLSYRSETRAKVFRGIVYFIIDISVNTQILIFVCMLFLIEERFRHLCKMVTFSRDDKLIVRDRLNGHFTLQQIWWFHCSLVNASELLNSVYAIQLLFWISTLAVDVLSRIYSLNVHKLSDFGKIRESMQAISSTWNLVLITTVCHVTMCQANRVGELIFSPYSSASMKRIFLQENLEAAAYFQLRKVYFFTIAGIIRVDLPLLLSIFSALTTYLVILT